MRGADLLLQRREDSLRELQHGLCGRGLVRGAPEGRRHKKKTLPNPQRDAELDKIQCLDCLLVLPDRTTWKRHARECDPMHTKCEPYRPTEPTVQCCDCGSYYHTAAAWKFHTETTTHIQCRDVKEKVQFFTKDADFGSSPASKPYNQNMLETAEADDPSRPTPIGATVSCQEEDHEPEADMPPLEEIPVAEPGSDENFTAEHEMQPRSRPHGKVCTGELPRERPTSARPGSRVPLTKTMTTLCGM